MQNISTSIQVTFQTLDAESQTVHRLTSWKAPFKPRMMLLDIPQPRGDISGDSSGSLYLCSIASLSPRGKKSGFSQHSTFESLPERKSFQRDFEEEMRLSDSYSKVFNSNSERSVRKSFLRLVDIQRDGLKDQFSKFISLKAGLSSEISDIDSSFCSEG